MIDLAEIENRVYEIEQIIDNNVNDKVSVEMFINEIEDILITDPMFASRYNFGRIPIEKVIQKAKDYLANNNK